MDFSQIKAKKSLWQNFLIDEEALFAIANAIEVEGKHIIEVGPGYGALTEHLLEAGAAKLELVELDSDMISILEKRKILDWQSVEKNITIHHIDVLQFLPKMADYSVIANIPYYITSPILFHFLYPWLSGHDFAIPESMVILMQKEVGEKILAEGKKNKYSYISLAMHEVCENIECVTMVPRTSFDPAPKVDSIVLKFTPKKERNFANEKKLLELWNIAFAHPRKTFLSNLKSAGKYSENLAEKMEELWYSATIRAEAIEREDWGEILYVLKKE